MIKCRVLTYERIIVLTIQRMEELQTLLLKHCDNIKYTATTKNEAEILFDSFDELCSFNNFGDDKITSLSMECRKNKDYQFMIDISFSPKYPYNEKIVRCMYRFSDVDNESIFVSDFRKFLDKTSIFHRKYMICEWASFAFFIILGLFPIFLPFNGTPFYKMTTDIKSLITGIGFFEFIAMILNKMCSKYIWEKLYPKVIYVWGEECEKYKSLEKLRSNLFWVVLVSPVLSIIIGLIMK